MTETRENHPILTNRHAIRVAPLLALPMLLDEFQIAWQPLLEQLGLPHTLLESPENTIPFAVAGKLLKICAAETGCPHFGLLLGQRNSSSTLGATGFLIRNAPDVGTALHELIEYFDLHDRGATPFIKKMPKTSILGYDISVGNIEGAEQVLECALAVAHNLMKDLCGAHWNPLEVHFRHGKPPSTEAYRHFFQAPVRFNADDNALIFRTTCLNDKVVGADTLLRHHFQQHVAQLRTRCSQDVKSQVGLVIDQLIASETCTLEAVAAHFSIHPRTLNRRLKEAGTSFREIVGQARHARACELLCATDHSIESISEILGYSSHAALNRAFASREGMPPGKWRSVRKVTLALPGPEGPVFAK